MTQRLELWYIDRNGELRKRRICSEENAQDLAYGLLKNYGATTVSLQQITTQEIWKMEKGGKK